MANEITETIAALATPIGRGGIGVIRVSGPKSFSIAQAILKRKTIRARHAYYLPFYDNDSHEIDRGVALFFKAPNSFTGEDVLELHAHGGPIVLDRLLKELFLHGARIAKPGEFSERAFHHNKMDLIQAEAIADLINASSEQAARSALASFQGEFSKRIHRLNDQLTGLRTYIEAAIDFSDDDIDFIKDHEVANKLDEAIQALEKIHQTAKQGSLLREGMSVVIVGKPNVGKSSLLNCLSGKDSAIVTDIAGTTRDVLREYIDLDGMPLHIIDTAGLQKTDDLIEKEGIRRTWNEVEKADKILFLVDGTQTTALSPEAIEPELFAKLSPSQSITIIRNKIDLTGEKPHIEKKGALDIVFISAKEQLGIDLLRAHLKNFMGFHPSIEGVFLARRRHLEALKQARECLFSAKKLLGNQAAIELIAEELRQAQRPLFEMTGELTSEDLLGKIFSTFCIGK